MRGNENGTNTTSSDQISTTNVTTYAIEIKLSIKQRRIPRKSLNKCEQRISKLCR